MEDLRRLYEHQTMVAIGIYSFLDNLLSRMPTSSESERYNSLLLDHSSLQLSESRNQRLPPDVHHLASSLAQSSRPDSFRNRQQRVRYLPRVSVRTNNGQSSSELETTGVYHNSESTAVEERLSSNSCVESTEKSEIAAGGYPEEMFLHLSEREKEEYMCSICYCVLKEAHQCLNDHRFCYGCIYTWSTGTGAGHDACPVCRCDGLYAKNIDLQEKINQKQTRCAKVGCNWIGRLSEHAAHEHRHYTPNELDLFGSAVQKAIASKCVRTITSPELFPTKGSNEGMSWDSERSDGEREPNVRSFGAQNAGAIPSTCQPLASSLEGLDDNGVDINVLRQGLTRFRMYYDVQRETSILRRSERDGDVPMRGNADSTSAADCEDSTHTRGFRFGFVGDSSAMHRNQPMSTNRTRNADIRPRQYSTLQTAEGQPLLWYGSSATPNSHGTEDAINNEDEREQVESSCESDSSPMVATRIPRLLPFRTMARYDAEAEIGHQYQAQLTLSSNGSIPTQRSNARSATRGQAYEGVTGLSNVCEDETYNMTHGLRRERVILPAINPVSQTCVRSPGRSGNRRISETEMWRQEEQRRTTPSAERSQSRPLEFRRLVPRQHGRVLEQLRETREQLAAMLRLMTLELEERRQQILSTALETASRTRALRSLNSQLATQLEEARERANPCNEMASREQTGRVVAAGERQSNEIQGCTNVLRNIPTPSRFNRVTRNRQSLQNLASRMLGNQLEIISRFEEARFPSVDDSQQTETTIAESSEQRFITPFNPRLLARLRIGTMRCAPVHSLLLVTSSNELSHSLFGARNLLQTTASEGSSDETEGSELEDTENERHEF